MNKVQSIGGNQYRVTINEETQVVDLDGVTIISVDDYEAIEKAGVSTEGFLTPADYNVTGEADLFWLEAAEEALKYSGFDVESYIAENE